MARGATPVQTRDRAMLLLWAAAALISVPAASLPAQTVELRPIDSLSLPTRISLQDGAIHLRQKVGFRVGARMTVRFSPRFDLTNTITYSPGSATLHGAGKRIEVKSASHSVGGSSAARYWLWPEARTLSWEVHTGLGILFGGRPSYVDLFESSTMSAMLGSVVRYQVGQIVSFTLRLQQRLLRLRFGDQDAGGSRPFQVAFGVGFPFLENLH
jgi:hypothetical protein